MEFTQEHFRGRWKTYLNEIKHRYSNKVMNTPFYRKHKRHSKVKKLFDEYNKVFSTYLKNKRVIDIGCGTGFYACLMSQYADYVTGIDTNSVFIENSNLLSSICGCVNIEFELISAHNLDEKYIIDKGINALFIHAAGGKGWVKGQTDILLAKCYAAGVDVIISSKHHSIITIELMEKKFRPHPTMRDNYKVTEITRSLCVCERI